MAKLRIEPPAPKPRPRGGVRLRYGRHDQLVIDTVEYTVQDCDHLGVTLARADNADVTQTLSRDQVDVLRHSPGFRHTRNFYVPAHARARSHAGVQYLTDLKKHEQVEILWKLAWCKAFIGMEERGETTRGDDDMLEAIEIIAKGIKAIEDRKSGKKRAGKKRAGDTDGPGPKALREWVNALIDGNMQALALRNNFRKCGYHAPRFTAEEYSILYSTALKYMSRDKPKKTVLHRKMTAEFGRLNTEIRRLNAEGREPVRIELNAPSYDRLCEEIKKLSKFDVMAGRRGFEVARNYFRANNQGLESIVRPLERVEIDEWDVQLHILFILARVWDKLSDQQKAAIERVRMVLCLAIDVATKCVVGMSLSRTACSANAIRTLDMMVSEKEDYVNAAGARTPWDVYGTPEELAADGGSSFANLDLLSRAIDLGITPKVMPGAVPFLRGNVERVFRSTDDKFLSFFPGRTFGNVVEKGDYDSQAHAGLALDELAEGLVRYAIDHYHNHPHDGLGGECPRAAWLRLTEEVGVDPPPDEHLRRVVFGLESRPVVGAHGLRVCGVDYQAREINELFRTKGEVNVECRIDWKNMGAISAQIGDGWLTVEGPEELDGVHLDDWEAAWDELQRRNTDMKNLTKPLLDDTISYLEKLAGNARKRASIADLPKTAEDLARIDRKMNIGVVFPKEKREAAARGSRDMYDGAIDVTGPAPPSGRPSKPAKTSRKARNARTPSKGAKAAKINKRAPHATKKAARGWKIEE